MNAGIHGDSVARARELRSVLDARIENPRPGEDVSTMQRQVEQLRQVRNDERGAAVVENVAAAHQIQLTHRRQDVTQERTFTSDTTTQRTTTNQVTANGSVDRSVSSSLQFGRDGVNSTRGIARRETNADVSSSNHETTTSNSGTFADGGISATRQRQTTAGETRADATGTEQRTTSSTSAAINADRALFTSNDGTRTRETTADGVHETSNSSSTRGGLVYGADGNGATFGRTNNHGTAELAGTDVTSSTQRSTSVDGTVTDHGATLAGRTSRTDVGHGNSTQYSLGGSGGFRVDIVPIPNRVPPKVAVETRVELRLNAGASTGAQSGSFSAGVEANGARIYTFRHAMTEEDANVYLHDAAAISEGSPVSARHPEFSFLERIRAATAHTSVRDLFATDDPQMAASLERGETVQSASTFGVTARGSASIGSAASGVGGSLSHGGSITRTVRVGRVDDPALDLVEIHLEYNAESTNAQSANARMDGIGMQVGHASANGHGHQVTIRLDPHSPTYASDYATVLAAETREQATTVAARFDGQLSRQTHQSDTTNASVGVTGSDGTPSMISVGGSSLHDEASDTGTGEIDPNTGRRSALSGTTTGTSTQQGSLNLGGRAVFTSSDSTVATNHLGPDGLNTVDVSQTQSRSIPGLPPAMQRSLHTTQSSLDEMRLTDTDIATLARRAESGDVWLNSIPGGMILHVQDAWNALGASLRSPNPDPIWVHADAVLADKLARGQAITHFIAHVDSGDGLAALRFVADRMSVGQTRQFPAELSTESTMFHEAETQVRGAGAYYQTLSGGDRERRIHDFGEHQYAQLTQVMGRVRACTTFRTSSAKVSTLTAIQDLLTRNDREMFAALAPGVMSADGPATPHERSTLALLQLQTYKAEEHRHWEHVQSEIQRGSHLLSLANPNDCYNAAVTDLEEIASTYPRWLAAVREAEATSPDAPELAALHPNPNWSISLLRQAARMASAGGQGNPDERAARWLAAANPAHH